MADVPSVESWTCERDGRLLRGCGTILIWNAAQQTVAEVPVSINGIPFSKEQEEAHARKFAAAPALLVACQEVCSDLGTAEWGSDKDAAAILQEIIDTHWPKLKAVIAQATKARAA